MKPQGSTDDGRDSETHEIIGAAIEVHRRWGAGFLEGVYQEALAIEFHHQGVPFEREVAIPIKYRDIQLASTFRADFVCFGSIIVELKALRQPPTSTTLRSFTT